MLATRPPAKDFVSDAFGHMKFIAYVSGAAPLLEAAGVADDLDAGCLELKSAKHVEDFVGMLGELRFWPREAALWPV